MNDKHFLKKKLFTSSVTVPILLLLFTIIPYIYYFPYTAARSTTHLFPMWDWIFSYTTIVIACGIMLLFAWYNHKKGIPNLPNIQQQVILTVIFICLTLILNPFAFRTLAQLPCSVISMFFISCFAVGILGRFSYLIMPPIFFISLFVYGLTIQNIQPKSHILEQIFVTSWEDAKNFLSVTNITLALTSIILAIVAWVVIYRRLRRYNKSTCISTGATYLLIFTLGMQPLQKHLHKNIYFSWPIGLTTSMIYETLLASKDIYYAHRLLKLIPQPETVDAELTTIKKDEGVICILHVGESVSANHLSLNGYNRKTTPNIDALPNIINFSECIASASSTDRAVLTILTNGRRDFILEKRKEYLPSSPPILDFFHATQFRCATFWTKGVLDDTKSTIRQTPFSRQIKMYIRKADDNFGYEDDVMNQSQQVIDYVNQYTAENMFLLINNAGSHAFFTNYNHNNPAFPLEAPPSSNLYPESNPKHAQILLNAYDSTIHYTDDYINRIMTTLKGRPFIYIYVSDHGEYVGDNGFWSRANAPHGIFFKYNACIVPCFIYASPEFESKHPHFKQALDNLRGNRHKTIAHEHIFHTLLGIFGIKTEYYDKQLDLCTPDAKSYTGPHPGRNGKSLD